MGDLDYFTFEDDLAENSQEYAGDEATFAEWEVRAKKLNKLSPAQKLERAKEAQAAIRELHSHEAELQKEIKFLQEANIDHHYARWMIHALNLHIHTKYHEALILYPEYHGSISSKSKPEIPKKITISFLLQANSKAQEFAKMMKQDEEGKAKEIPDRYKELGGHYDALAKLSAFAESIGIHIDVDRILKVSITSRHPQMSVWSLDIEPAGEETGYREMSTMVDECLKGALGLKKINTKKLSRAQADTYVDVILSRNTENEIIDDFLYNRNLILQILLEKFQQMSLNRKRFLLDEILKSYNETNQLNIHELHRLFENPGLSDAQKIAVARTIFQKGNDIDIHRMRIKYPKYYEEVASQLPHRTPEGYLSTLGENHLFDHYKKRPGRPVHIVVHPFFDIVDSKDEDTLGYNIVERLNKGFYFTALELYQENENLQNAKAKNETIVLVLPRYMQRDELLLARTIKQILGDYEHFYIVESINPYSGYLVEYNKAALSAKLVGEKVIFSGGYVGKCLQAAKDDFAELGIAGSFNIEASTTVARPLDSPSPENPIHNLSEAAAFFDQHHELNHRFNDEVTGELLTSNESSKKELYHADSEMEYRYLKRRFLEEKSRLERQKLSEPTDSAKVRQTEVLLEILNSAIARQDLIHEILGHYAFPDRRFINLYEQDLKALHKHKKFREKFYP